MSASAAFARWVEQVTGRLDDEERGGQGGVAADGRQLGGRLAFEGLGDEGDDLRGGATGLSGAACAVGALRALIRHVVFRAFGASTLYAALRALRASTLPDDLRALIRPVAHSP